MPWTDPAKKKAYQRQYYKKNKEVILAKNKVWQKANPDNLRRRTRAWAANNKDKIRAKSLRSYYERGGKDAQWEKLLMELYGITPFGYNTLFKIQGGVCAICGKPPSSRRLDVDHDHVSKRVRGLLCNRCNKGLHMFYDNPAFFNKAKFYLEERDQCISKVLQQKEVGRTRATKPKTGNSSPELQLF